MVTNDSPQPGSTPDEQSAARFRTLGELERVAGDVVNELAQRTDPEAFQALLRLSGLVGEALGVSARTLATSGSWAKVAEAAGTSRQAAWSRWSS